MASFPDVTINYMSDGRPEEFNEIQGKTFQQLVELPASDIGYMNRTQIGSLTADQFKIIFNSADRFQKLTWQIGGLTKEQLLGLQYRLNELQFSSITKEQFGWFERRHISLFSVAQIRQFGIGSPYDIVPMKRTEWLTKNHIGWLNIDQLLALRVGKLTSQQVNWYIAARAKFRAMGRFSTREKLLERAKHIDRINRINRAKEDEQALLLEKAPGNEIVFNKDAASHEEKTNAIDPTMATVLTTATVDTATATVDTATAAAIFSKTSFFVQIVALCLSFSIVFFYVGVCWQIAKMICMLASTIIVFFWAIETPHKESQLIPNSFLSPPTIPEQFTDAFVSLLSRKNPIGMEISKTKQRVKQRIT